MKQFAIAALLAGLPTATLTVMLAGCRASPSRAHGKRLIVLGVDAMDPGFLSRHFDALPNLKRLRDLGGLTRLATTSPPQSPVAWSTFITGTDPEQTGVFDFVQRDPATGKIFSSLGETIESAHHLDIGPYSLPLSKAHVRVFRTGRPFWELLAEHGIPATVVHMPTNYPPVERGQALAGMGTPDLEGAYGTFTYYTDDPLTPQGPVSGGRIVTVEPRDNRVILPIGGPPNTLRRDRRPPHLELIADIDPDARAMRGRIGDQQFILQQGEWSPWIHVRFRLIPGLSSMSGMFRLYARELSPSIQIYRSPLNIDPADPALPISYPSIFSRELSRRIGPYYTQGIPEDTSALRQGVLTLDEFLAQTRLIAADDNALLDDALSHFRDGLLFFYFSEIDQNSHMLWAKHETKLLETYQYVDRALGRVMAHAQGANIIVMSDHGFAAFDRSVNLNTWLAQEGFQTKAYALGLNALYLNRIGLAKPERGALLQELIRRLRELRDPATGRLMIESVSVVGPSSSKFAPDLIVGYAPGYRASWETALGEAPPGIVHQNTDAWIGDHCIAAEAVPGVLLGNRSPRLNTPRLKDITVTILKEFDVSPDPAMSGIAVY
jgi:predicted AlkP superfamily phosphohydrolase/phosphomutase